MFLVLADFTNSVLKKYGNKKKNGFVFDIIDIKQVAMTQYKKIINLTRYVNDHIKKIAKGNDLPLDLSKY
jgi:hypothetical protein